MSDHNDLVSDEQADAFAFRTAEVMPGPEWQQPPVVYDPDAPFSVHRLAETCPNCRKAGTVRAQEGGGPERRCTKCPWRWRVGKRD